MEDLFTGSMPWWCWPIFVACVYVGHQMSNFSASDIIAKLHEEIKNKTKELKLMADWNAELTDTLVTTGKLSYGPDEIKHGQKFWRVTGVKERVVYEHAGQWGLFLIHNKDTNGVPTKTEIASLGWVEKEKLLDYLRGHLYRLEREEDQVQEFEDALDSTPLEQLQEQLSGFGFTSDEGKSALS